MGIALEWCVMHHSEREKWEVFGTKVQGYHNAPDAELVRQVQMGEIIAFEELVRRYRNDVFRFAHHFLRNREDAWDASQEVFIKAFRSIRQFRGDASFKTWLMRITCNQCKDMIKGIRAKGVSLELTAQVEESSSGGTPRDSAELSEIEQAILDALKEMSFKHQSVFVLREMEQLSYKEIAQILKCNVGTVMSRLHYARKKIQENLIRRGIKLE